MSLVEKNELKIIKINFLRLMQWIPKVLWPLPIYINCNMSGKDCCSVSKKPRASLPRY